MFDDEVLGIGRDTKVAAAALIEDPREDTWGMETSTALPVNGAVRRDQRGRLEVADQALIGNQRRRAPGFRTRAWPKSLR